MSKEAGKGSKRRPSQIPQKQFEQNWDKIFKPIDKSNNSPYNNSKQNSGNESS